MGKSTVLETANGYFKNVQTSPNKDLLAISQSDAKLVIKSVAEDSSTIYIDLLNESNCTAWFPIQPGPAGVVASASNDRPIVLYNAMEGCEICKYLTMNHVEAIDAPLSIDFTYDGGRLVCGGLECIRVFDVQRPGREYDLLKLSDTRASKDGLKGRVSALSVRKDSSLIAAVGTFNGCLGVVDLNNLQLIFESTGKIGALQQIAFSEDGWSMYTYSRKAESILCWDLRNMSIRQEIPRPNMNTNQRLHFDVHSGMIGFGDTVGNVYIYSLNDGKCIYNANICDGTSISGVSLMDSDNIICSSGNRGSLCGSVTKIKFK